MRKGLFLALFVLLLLPSCNHKKVRKPEVLLTEQQMIDVLADVYLIEARLNQMRSVGENVTPYQDTYYDQVFEHYGITDTIFDANMYYYSHELPVLERIMDSVMNRFANAQRK